jgi:hypothetical protein
MEGEGPSTWRSSQVDLPCPTLFHKGIRGEIGTPVIVFKSKKHKRHITKPGKQHEHREKKKNE